MILDATTRFSENQAITSGATLSTNTINLVNAMDLAEGQQLYLHIHVTETFAGGTDLRIDCLNFSSASSYNQLGSIVFGNDPSATDLGTNNVLALGAGVHFYVALAPAGQAITTGGVTVPTSVYPSVLLLYTPTGTFTAGKITADIVLHPGVAARIYPASTSS